ncbi:MAG: hypothetical protein AB1295_06245 [Candidatus Micrarchaeota archaeon]
MRRLLTLLLLSALIFAGSVNPLLEPAISNQIFGSSSIFDLLKDAGCSLCDDLSSCTSAEFMLSANTISHELQVVFYNGTIARSPIVNAPLIVYIHNESMDEIYKIYTDDEGVASFGFGQWSDSCHDYTIFHCKGQYGCDFATCVDAIGINRSDLGVEDIDDIPLAPDATASGGAQDPENVLPTYANYRYCPPPPALGTSMPVFCLPLILIMAFLLGAMFLSGKNPFIFFDFSSPRMGKYVRYTARGRGFGFDMVSMASAATTVVSVAKNPKAMMKKSMAAMKSGKGMAGGVAGAVERGVHTVPGTKAIKKMAKGGSTWGKGGGLEGAKAVWGTAAHGFKSSAIGQIVSATKAGWKGGSLKGLGALGLALAQYSSFGQLVGAIQTAAMVWAVASSIPVARKELQAWSGTTRLKDVNGNVKEIEAKFIGNKLVFTVFDIDVQGQRVGDGKTVKNFTELVTSFPPKDLGQLTGLRNEGFSQLQRFHRTVLFYAPLEIADKKTDLANYVKKALSAPASGETSYVTGLKGKGRVNVDKDTALTYTDPASGNKIKVTVGDLHGIAGSDSGSGVLVKMTSAKSGEPPKFQIVSEKTFETMQKQPPEGVAKVFSAATLDLSGIVSGLDSKNKTVQALGLHSQVAGATQINSMTQMVAASGVMFRQLEQIQANSAGHFNDRRNDFSASIQNLGGEALSARVTVGTETKTLADWVKEGKMDLVVTTLAKDPSQAPKELVGLAKSAQSLYNGEAVQMGNFASIYQNTQKFSAMLSGDTEKTGLIAWNLKGTELLKAQVHAQMTITQLTVVAQGRTFDVSVLDNMDFSQAKSRPPPQYMSSVVQVGLMAASGLLGEKGSEMLKSFEESRKKLEAMASRNEEQDRQLQIYGLISDAAKTQQKMLAAKNPDVRARLESQLNSTVAELRQAGTSALGVTETQGLLYKSQALANLSAMFTTPASATQVEGYRLERAAYSALYDMTTNPGESLKTLGILQGLINVRNDPARFKTLADGLENYSLSVDPKERDTIYRKIQLEDATNRFGEAVRIRAISSHFGAEEALQKAVDAQREKSIEATSITRGGSGLGSMADTQAAVRAPFNAVDKEKEEYKAAEQDWKEKTRALEEAQKKGTSGAEYDRLLWEESQAQKTLKRERAEYYRACFNILGGSAPVDNVIKEHVPPGSKERDMWQAYQGFSEKASKSPDISTASKTLNDLAGKPDDPFRSMRTGLQLEGVVAPFRTAVGLPSPAQLSFNYSDAMGLHQQVFGEVASKRKMSIAELRAQMGL